MANDTLRLKERNEIEDLIQAFNRCLPDPGIQSARPEIHERRVKGNRQTFLPENFRNPDKVLDAITLQIDMVEPYLRVDTVLHDHGKILFKEKVERHVDLHPF